MRTSHPTVSAVLAFIHLSLPDSAHGQELDRSGGFLDIKGARTGFLTPADQPSLVAGHSRTARVIGHRRQSSDHQHVGVEIEAAYRRAVEQRFALLKKAAEE